MKLDGYAKGRNESLRDRVAGAGRLQARTETARLGLESCFNVSDKIESSIQEGL